MGNSSSVPETGALVHESAWTIHRRVVGALLIREMLTRYGRNNIGFLWLFVEPAAFVLIVTVMWTSVKNVHVSNLPIVAFAVTGYSSLLLWRNPVGRSIGAVRSNKALLYHRRVTISDVFTARILLEVLAVSTAFVGISLAFYAVGWLQPPEDALHVVWGWLLLAWFGAGLALTVGGLSEKAEVVGRFWHPISYILMTVSGVAFIADVIPPAMRSVLLKVPMLNAVEYIREGWFGSAMHAYYDLGYLIACNIAVTILGLALVRQIGFDSSDDE